MLPNFICPGAQKAGTTTLHTVLSKLPGVYLPNMKESSFFSNEDAYKKGIDWYEKTYFSRATNQKAIGEICVSYMYFPQSAERIYRHLGPKLKLVFLFRNPVTRAYSHYHMMVKRGHEKLTFENAVEEEPRRLSGGRDFRTRDRYSYIDRGYYARQLEIFLGYYPIENMLFLVFEEFVSNLKEHMKEILGFLGLEDEATDQNAIRVRSNPSSRFKSNYVRDLLYRPTIVKDLLRPIFPLPVRSRLLIMIERRAQVEFEPPPLDTELRRTLMPLFLDDIQKLEDWIGRDLSIWYGGLR
jgi:hypothetical protein